MTDADRKRASGEEEEKTTKEKEIKLERRLDFWNGASIIVGAIVGSGIFVSPKGVLAHAGSPGLSLVVWSICGLFTLLGALCFSELGTSITSSGGEYTYISLAYGPILAFIYLWVSVVVVVPCSTAIAALTFARYILQPFYSECAPPDSACKLIAVALTFLLVYINCVSVSGSLRLQSTFSLAKVLALVIIVAYGCYYIIQAIEPATFSSSESIWANSQTSIPQLTQAFYSGVFTFAGWNSLNYVTEELKDPTKNLPRAVIVSISTVTLIYIFANAAYFAVLTSKEILTSEAIAVTFGERVIPFAKWFMPLTVALSIMSGMNASIYTWSRMFMAGAKTGQLPAVLNTISVSHLSPISSLIFIGLSTSLYLLTNDVYMLINYTVFVEALLGMIGVSTVLTLRRKFPDIPRPLKIYTFVPVLYLFACSLMLILPIWTSPWEAFMGLSITFVGLPLYYLFVKGRENSNLLGDLNKLVQKLTLSVEPSE